VNDPVGGLRPIESPFRYDEPLLKRPEIAEFSRHPHRLAYRMSVALVPAVVWRGSMSMLPKQRIPANASMRPLPRSPVERVHVEQNG